MGDFAEDMERKADQEIHDPYVPDDLTREIQEIIYNNLGGDGQPTSLERLVADLHALIVRAKIEELKAIRKECIDEIELENVGLYIEVRLHELEGGEE